MGEWFADVIHAWRRLRSAPAFTLFSVLTLALGIGATTAIYSVVYAAVLRPPDIRDIDRVANLYHADPRRPPVFDPLIVALVPAAFIVASLIAAYFPARRAARVDPNVALRRN
jgi:ABC-type antimicrobial peptide transport system permease subunit